MQLAPSEEKQIQTFQYWNSFAVFNWYSKLESITFKTDFVDVSIEQAKEFVKYQQRLLEMVCETDDDMPSFEEYNGLILLKKQLSKIISEKNYFVKMSDRSAKDSATEHGRLEKHLKPLIEKEKLKFLNDEENDENDKNFDLKFKNYLLSNEIALPIVYKAFGLALQINNGKEA